MFFTAGQLMFEIRNLFVAVDDLPFAVSDFLLQFAGFLLKVSKIPLVPSRLAPKLLVRFAQPLDFTAKPLKKGCATLSPPNEKEFVGILPGHLRIWTGISVWVFRTPPVYIKPPLLKPEFLKFLIPRACRSPRMAATGFRA